MYESSGSEFFGTATKIQLGPDAFDKSRSIMTFLTNLGVTDIFFSFRLVLEKKTGKEIPESSRLEFLEKFLQTILLRQLQKVYLGIRYLNKNKICHFV